jgi:hypothetical protein
MIGRPTPSPLARGLRVRDNGARRVHTSCVTVAGDPGGYELAYLEGKAAVAEQSATLKETRDRAGTIASAAAVVAGLGVSFGFTNGQAHKLGVLGVVAALVAAGGFTTLMVAAVMVWRPFEGVFTLDAGMIVGSYVEGTPPALLPEIHRELAIHIANHAAFNRDRLDDRLQWFSVLLYAFLAEVVGLMVALIEISR